MAHSFQRINKLEAKKEAQKALMHIQNEKVEEVYKARGVRVYRIIPSKLAGNLDETLPGAFNVLSRTDEKQKKKRNKEKCGKISRNLIDHKYRFIIKRVFFMSSLSNLPFLFQKMLYRFWPRLEHRYRDIVYPKDLYFGQIPFNRLGVAWDASANRVRIPMKYRNSFLTFVDCTHPFSSIESNFLTNEFA